MRVASFILAAGLVLAVARPARADGLYFRESFGGTGFGGRLADFYDGGFTVNVGLGANLGRFALEGTFSTAFVDGVGLFAGRHYDSTSIGVRALHLTPITSWAQIYGRAGLLATRIDGAVNLDARGDDYRGRGLELGGGLVVAGRMPWIGLLHPALLLVPCLRRGPRVSVSAWLDVGQQWTRLHRPLATSLDGTLTTWSLGFGLGGSF